MNREKEASDAYRLALATARINHRADMERAEKAYVQAKGRALAAYNRAVEELRKEIT